MPTKYVSKFKMGAEGDDILIKDTELRSIVNTLMDGIDDPYTYLNGKTVICVGDSLVYGGAGGKNIAWPKLLADKYGCTCYNYGINGSPISNYGGAADAIVDRVLTIMTAHEDCDIFIVEGGANDKNNDVPLGNIGSYNSTDFYGAINLIIQRVEQKYTGVQLVFMTEPKRYNTANNLNLTSEYYAQAMIQACSNRSIPCFDTMSALGFNLYDSYYSWADYGFVHTGTRDHHWSEAAYNKMTPIIAKFLFNNGYNTTIDNRIFWTGVNQLKLYNGWAFALAQNNFTDQQTTQFQGDIYGTPTLSVPVPQGLFDPSVNNGAPYFTFAYAFSSQRWIFATSAALPDSTHVNVKVLMADTGPRTISGTVYALFIGRWK